MAIQDFLLSRPTPYSKKYKTDSVYSLFLLSFIRFSCERFPIYYKTELTTTFDTVQAIYI